MTDTLLIESLKSLIRDRVNALPDARRNGYDRDAVEALAVELIERLDEAGEIETKPVTTLSRRHVERLQEKMAELLNTAEENAEELKAEAEERAAKIEEEARNQVGELTAQAEREARSEREAADRYVTEAKRASETELAKARQESERQAQELVAAARNSARELIDSAEARRRELEAVVGKLEQQRDQVARGLTQVARHLDSTVEELGHLGDVQEDSRGSEAGQGQAESGEAEEAEEGELEESPERA